MVDRNRRGRPPTLDGAAQALLETALASLPLDHGYPETIWTVADMTDQLRRSGFVVLPVTVNRTLHAMGYCSRRPRHHLTHRQDADAVASAKHALAELHKRGHLPGRDSDLSTWMNATPPHPHLAVVWQRCGAPTRVPGGHPSRRRAVFGALDYATGQLFSQLIPHMGGDAFATFLEHIAQT